MTTTRPLSLRDINAALRDAGHDERLARGRGYFFFCGGEAARWPVSGVYVASLDQLTVDEWLERRDTLARAR